MQKGLIILFLSVLILYPSAAKGGGEGITLPKDWGEIKAFGQRFWDVTIGILPNFIEKTWKEEVLPFWQKMGDWFTKNIFNPYIQPFFKSEIESRKPIIEEEFQKEKKEMKEGIKTEVPKASKSIWEKIEELIQ